MFSSTVHQVVRSLGKDTLLPVPSLDDADNISPLSLVVKETRRHCLFWTKQKCLTTEFKLSDVLEQASKPPDFKVDSKVLCTFNRTTDISLKGKFGVELTKELFDVDLEGARSVLVKSPLGDLQKEEVALQPLIRELNPRRINLNHPLVKPLTSENKTLCIVTSVITLADDAALSSEVKFDESGKVGGTFSCISSSAVSADVSEEVDEKKTKSMTVKKGTKLAYTIYELLISTNDGSFELQLDTDTKGGFTTESVADRDEVDAVPESFSGAPPSANPGVVMQGLVELPERQREQTRLAIRGIMEMPQTIQPLSLLLTEAEVFIDNNIEKNTNTENLRQKLGYMDDDLQQFLSLVGFTIKDGNVDYPRATTPVFESCQFLMNLLDELDDDQLDTLVRCVDDGETALDLISILERTQKSRNNRFDLSPTEAAIFTTDTAKNFLDAIDLTVEENILVIPQDNRMDVSAAFFVLYALYGSTRK